MTQAQEVALSAWLEARFCRSTVEIRAHVAAECGLNYSHSGSTPKTKLASLKLETLHEIGGQLV